MAEPPRDPEQPAPSGEPDDPRPELTVERAATVAEQSIRQAQRAGAFDHLPGAGKPLVGLDSPSDPDWWARDKLRREQADLSQALPVVLRLRREKEGLLGKVLTLPTEERARAHLEDFNARVLHDRRQPVAGPASPPVVSLVDIEEYLVVWRQQAARTARARAAAAAEEGRREEEARRQRAAERAARRERRWGWITRRGSRRGPAR